MFKTFRTSCLFYFLLGISQLALSQLEATESLFIGPAQQNLFVSLKVKKIVATAIQGDTSVVLCEKKFNEKGECAEDVMPGGGICRYQYYLNGYRKEKACYPENSPAFYERVTYGYDSTATSFKQSVITYSFNGRVDTVISEYKTLVKSDKLTKKRRDYPDGKGYSGFVLDTDSIQGDYHFRINQVYYVTQLSGEVYHSRSITRSYTISQTAYWDNIESQIVGGKEIYNNCFSKYKDLDKKGRVVEEGCMRYLSEQTQEVPDSLVKALLDGKLRDKKYRVYDNWVTYYEYEVKGFSKTWDGFKQGSTIRYNAKNQLIEIVNLDELKTKSQYTYDEKGLLISHLLFELKDGKTRKVMEQRYAYTFY